MIGVETPVGRTSRHVTSDLEDVRERSTLLERIRRAATTAATGR